MHNKMGRGGKNRRNFRKSVKEAVNEALQQKVSTEN